MKLLKALVLTFTALFLFAGCYTQLKYSQQMNKVTDAQYVQDESDEQVTERDSRSSDVTEEDVAVYAEANDIPIYYKNYYVANWWNDCACSPYGYTSYSDYWYYDRFHFGSPYYYSRHHYYSDPYVRWKLRHHRWSHFGSSFTMSWRWGYHYPHHYYRYYDPFYYDPFVYNYYGHPIAYNNYYFYGRGYGYYWNRGNVDRGDNNRRYGPRGIGTSRTVTDDSNRARERQSVTNSGNRSTTSAPRTVGTSRTRSTSSDTITRSTNSGNSVTTTRTRSVQRKKDDTTSNTTRTRSRSGDNNSKSVSDDQNRRRTISLPRYVNTSPRTNEKVRQRIRSSKVPASSVNVRSNSRERKTFLKRVGSFINNTTSTISNSTTRSRSRTVKINSSSGKRSSSSVTRSKSSSSSTRSRGSVSRSKSSSSSSSGNTRSRSRSGGSSDRSRGNN